MPILFAEIPVVVGLAFALFLILAADVGMMAAGRFKTRVQAEGGTASGAYYLKVTLFLIFILACLFSGLFLLTSYR